MCGHPLGLSQGKMPEEEDIPEPHWDGGDGGRGGVH